MGIRLAVKRVEVNAIDWSKKENEDVRTKNIQDKAIFLCQYKYEETKN